MVTVYDSEGVAHEKQSVDARECVEVLGWSLTAPEEKPAKKGSAKEEVKEKTST